MSKEIKPGQWFATGTYLINGFGGHPKRCTRVSKSRVYYVRWYEDPERYLESEKREQYCDISSCQFISDTREEVEAIHALGIKQYDEINETTAAIRLRYQEQLKALRESFRKGGGE
ncbi:hypothetical protein [Rhodoferax mekongensis]|uniref:DUF4222 domain-containing protein n=1 Tax=Rhodoferax mekongensis TaxID=3068341 RepID=A0ABZ0B3Q9_9BURK|nr:hypothetical protein [Rhodoferax sp. TBRC 17307]WNO06001.1 hypothetical protein RAN89_06115 [Rhodoferax sp. TBRC 17307]